MFGSLDTFISIGFLWMKEFGPLANVLLCGHC
jgi:hypothetical protein